MKIRKANSKEREESLDIAKNLKEWFTPIAVAKMKRHFIKNLLVAIDKKVLGFLNYKINKKSIIILNLAVKREYQGRGIGSMLLNALEKIARNNKISNIVVETLTYEDNYKPYEKTREFYLKKGFVYKYIKKAKKKGYDDLVIMEKKL